MLSFTLLAGCGGSFSDPEVKDAVERVAGTIEKQSRAIQSTHPVGERIALPSGETFTVTDVGSDLDGVMAGPGERLIVVKLSLANGGQQPITLDPVEDFYVTSEAGRAFRPIAVRNLREGHVAPGETVSGTLAFSIPPEASALRFYWRQSPLTAVPLA